mmetsp:Transcript_20257/g.50382  ORF Transcript_20257/g.50382 Transcript_20257/m.50382 type:complete len:164 (+) Transcript_20257:405-896(+)
MPNITNTFDGATVTPELFSATAIPLLSPTAFPTVYNPGSTPGMGRWNDTGVQPEPVQTSVEYTSEVHWGNIVLFVNILVVVLIAIFVPLGIFLQLKARRRNQQRGNDVANIHNHPVEVAVMSGIESTTKTHDGELEVPDGNNAVGTGDYPTSYADASGGAGGM